ncbi:ABC transporter substrate-binding protein [Candidatus Formimonas warabiya]|uniref:ABC transporter substrate-binding protein n=1 Tax=Formimonas warabiya TaxID=1761012 RepID=A0A3G1KQU1_FORW1|nr:ABC transporter substrate-binding protein [Candidatus Formimonas warabiya]ATW24833.1 hypothetical protein DCMF_08650 [Candidatus Formimonas warabiya]
MRIKHLLCLLPVLLIAFSLTACTGGTTSDNMSGTTTDNSAQQTSAPRELRVLSFGGAYDETLTKHLAAFEAENNCKVTFVNATGADILVKVNNGECDLIFSDPVLSFQGEAKGLFAPINATTVPNVANLYKRGILSDCTVIHDVGAYGIAYNPDLVKTPPTSWNDLWDPQYAGKVAIRVLKSDTIELMVWAAKQAGGDEKNIDPGFAAMAKLAPNINTFVTDHPAMLQLFQEGSIAMSTWTDGRVAWAQEQGANVKLAIPKEGGFCLVTSMNAVKNSSNLDLAYKYIDMELGVEAQADIGNDLRYFPMNKDAYAKLSDDTKSKMGFTPDNIEQAQMADWGYIATVKDQWSERWEKEVVAKAKK